ncbi:uncharacterized protein B0I36DRAFT_355439 [Microdochium trichocladiopsis]|uniref:Apple domain-containing protein n=1 Tax=Microdochium trichocladiopsis TaxID=1682393 RepID=A0A9P8XUS5_9PEZI|nr:uncharacterized protein B0I36DRAFT_355439 [Microdochium trichocladiopsis]KAH7014187.1 hypothetical protein B0I36DRAFT_355439 [Microdochium trichocladiopsis]
MKTAFLLSLAGLSTAQLSGFDWDAIDAAGPPAEATVPVGVVTASTADYASETAAASVASDVIESPLTAATAVATPVPSAIPGRRHRFRRDACAPQPAGYGPVADPDTPQGFLNFAAFSSAANGVTTPRGYSLNFKNLQGSVENNGAIMGWYTLSSYDVGYCASQCNSVSGCNAFNIYYERDPSLDPAPSCANPASTTVMKCILWGQAVSAASATNTGQWRNDFQVVIAGSNGYTKTDISPIDGYDGPTPLGNAAIQAPLDCSGYDTYLGVKIFQTGVFDANLCATACTAQSDYNRRHPPANGGYVKTCQFFSTYMLLKNGIAQHQECALYTMAWDPSYAKNKGQWRGNDHYTINQSYSFVNQTNHGTSRYPCNGTPSK